MPRYEFRCDGCGYTEDVHASFDDDVPTDHPCDMPIEAPERGDDLEPGDPIPCGGVMRRVWGTPAIGRGDSGGTPPRAGRQRFMKGDAGWTNG